MVERYAHWRDIPAEAWRWRDFPPAEIADRLTGEIVVDEVALDRLQALRDHLGKPVMVISGYRSAANNRRAGGGAGSGHLTGSAFCVGMLNHDPAQFEAAARGVGFTEIGRYPAEGLMHIGLGSARTFGAPFPPGAGTFSAEPAPATAGFSPAGITAVGIGAGLGMAGQAADASDHGKRLVGNLADMSGLAPHHVTWLFVAGCLLGGLGLIGRHWFTHRRPKD